MRSGALHECFQKGAVYNSFQNIARLGGREKQSCGFAGGWRDLAVERACEAVSVLKPSLRFLPHKTQQLYGAPAGSVTLFTADVPDIVDAAITPIDETIMGMKMAMPINCAFSPKLEAPLW